MKTIFAQGFLKDLKALSKPMRFRVDDLIHSLECLPDLRSVPNIKKLTSSQPFYRIRLGDYRVGIKIAGDTCMLLRCLHRRDIYRVFP
jgi:mRNA interferase RelE/StbE